ncbi:MAG: hypothetical protein NE330_13725 [Lentisphaeraceae bacterium]|nr:hypothetical protein [Lentisphaeraceae bacterium]
MSELFIGNYTWEEVMKRGGFVMIAEIDEILDDNGLIKIKILAKYGPLESADFYIGDKSEDFKIGASSEIQLYTGIEWNDPEISPIDNRLQDGLYFGSLKVGEKVLAVSNFGSFELLAYRDDLQTSLDTYK